MPMARVTLVACASSMVYLDGKSSGVIRRKKERTTSLNNRREVGMEKRHGLGKSGLCQELVMNGGAEETFIRNRVSIMSLDLLY